MDTTTNNKRGQPMKSLLKQTGITFFFQKQPQSSSSTSSSPSPSSSTPTCEKISVSPLSIQEEDGAGKEDHAIGNDDNNKGESPRKKSRTHGTSSSSSSLACQALQIVLQHSLMPQLGWDLDYFETHSSRPLEKIKEEILESQIKFYRINPIWRLTCFNSLGITTVEQLKEEVFKNGYSMSLQKQFVEFVDGLLQPEEADEEGFRPNNSTYAAFLHGVMPEVDIATGRPIDPNHLSIEVVDYVARTFVNTFYLPSNKLFQYQTMLNVKQMGEYLLEIYRGMFQWILHQQSRYSSHLNGLIPYQMTTLQYWQTRIKVIELIVFYCHLIPYQMQQSYFNMIKLCSDYSAYYTNPQDPWSIVRLANFLEYFVVNRFKVFLSEYHTFDPIHSLFRQFQMATSHCVMPHSTTRQQEEQYYYQSSLSSMSWLKEIVITVQSMVNIKYGHMDPHVLLKPNDIQEQREELVIVKLLHSEMPKDSSSSISTTTRVGKKLSQILEKWSMLLQQLIWQEISSLNRLFQCPKRPLNKVILPMIELYKVYQKQQLLPIQTIESNEVSMLCQRGIHHGLQAIAMYKQTLLHSNGSSRLTESYFNEDNSSFVTYIMKVILGCVEPTIEEEQEEDEEEEEERKGFYELACRVQRLKTKFVMSLIEESNVIDRRDGHILNASVFVDSGKDSTTITTTRQIWNTMFYEMMKPLQHATDMSKATYKSMFGHRVIDHFLLAIDLAGEGDCDINRHERIVDHLLLTKLFTTYTATCRRIVRTPLYDEEVRLQELDKDLMMMVERKTKQHDNSNMEVVFNIQSVLASTQHRMWRIRVINTLLYRLKETVYANANDDPSYAQQYITEGLFAYVCTILKSYDCKDGKCMDWLYSKLKVLLSRRRSLHEVLKDTSPLSLRETNWESINQYLIWREFYLQVLHLQVTIMSDIIVDHLKPNALARAMLEAKAFQIIKNLHMIQEKCQIFAIKYKSCFQDSLVQLPQAVFFSKEQEMILLHWLLKPNEGQSSVRKDDVTEESVVVHEITQLMTQWDFGYKQYTTEAVGNVVASSNRQADSKEFYLWKGLFL